MCAHLVLKKQLIAMAQLHEPRISRLCLLDEHKCISGCRQDCESMTDLMDAKDSEVDRGVSSEAEKASAMSGNIELGKGNNSERLRSQYGYSLSLVHKS
jgi:hypothetical protein